MRHELRAPAQQIPHGPQLRIVDVSLGQNAQPLQLRQVKRVMLVIGVLDAVLLLDLSRIGQLDGIARRA